MRHTPVGPRAGLLALAALTALAAGSTGVPADEPIVRPRPKNGDVIAAPAAKPGTGVIPAPRRIGDALRDRSGAETRRPIGDAVALVRNLKVEPRASSVAFSFDGPPDTVPILELAEAPPVLGADGRWGFPPGRGGTAYPVGGDKAKGEYRLDLQDRRELQPAWTYYWVLNVRSNSTDPNALRQQNRGKFDTVSQTVRVFFQRIEVLNDSDPAGDGELTFAFWANGGDTPGGRKWLGDRDPLHWGDGSFHEIDVVLEVPSAPDQLTIQVDGYDDDGNLFQTQPYKSDEPLKAPADSGGDERNLARRSFDLTHTKNNELFNLLSMPNGGDKGDLAFSVIGRVEITRVSGGAPTSPAGPASPSGIGITPAPRDRNYLLRPGGVVGKIPTDQVVKPDPPAPFVTADGVTGQFQVLIPASRETGTATIKWDAGAEPEAKLFMRMGDGPEAVWDGRPKGFKDFDVELGGKYSFRLHQEGRRTRLLASVDVTGERPRQKPPVFQSGPGGAERRRDLRDVLSADPGRVKLTDEASGRPLQSGVIPAPRKTDGVIVASKPGGNAGSLRERLILPRPKLPTADVVTLVRKLKVVPSANAVLFTFEGPPDTVPILEIGKAAPVLGADGRWGFPPDTGATAYPVGGTPATGVFRIDLQDRVELERATLYHYILNVRTNNTDPKALRQQLRGKFTTASQTVRVKFDYIDAAGVNLTFAFNANGGDIPGGPKWLGDRQRLQWEKGRHPIDVALEIPDAPDQLSIQVDGYDDASGLVEGLPFKPGPLTRRGLAKRSFNLTELKDGELFTLESNSSGALRFTAGGCIEIARAGEATGADTQKRSLTSGKDGLLTTIPGKRFIEAPAPGGLTAKRPTDDVVRELKPPFITANDTLEAAAVIIPKDQNAGTAGIAWDAGRNEEAQVYLSIDGGKETLFDEQYRGRKRTEILLGKTYTFRVHNPRGRGGVFAEVTVTGHHPRPPFTGGAVPDTFRPGGVIAAPEREKLDDMATGKVRPGATGAVGLEPRKGGVILRDRLSGPRTKLPIDAVSTLIRNLRVLPSASNVVMTFDGPPNTVPLLEICKAAPVLGTDGRWGFPAGQGGTAYPVGGNKEQGQFKVDIGFITELQPDTSYHYLLNLRTDNTDPNARRQQVQGKFRTISQTVRITFSSIHVENDSDPGSNGDLTFVFWANGGDTPGGERMLGAPPKTLDWGEGDHDVNVVLEVPNAPDQLSIQVDGYDDDTAGTPIGALSKTPLAAPRDTGVDERNLARLAFDLSQDFDGRTTRSFLMKSLRAGGGGEGDLLFEVSGTVEVIRSLEIAKPGVGAPAKPAAKPVLVPRRRLDDGILKR